MSNSFLLIESGYAAIMSKEGFVGKYVKLLSSPFQSFVIGKKAHYNDLIITPCNSSYGYLKIWIGVKK
jgi:hypothetical protein